MNEKEKALKEVEEELKKVETPPLHALLLARIYASGVLFLPFFLIAWKTIPQGVQEYIGTFGYVCAVFVLPIIVSLPISIIGAKSFAKRYEPFVKLKQKEHEIRYGDKK